MNESMFEQKVYNIKYTKSLKKRKIEDVNFGNIAKFIYNGAESLIVSIMDSDKREKEKDFIRTVLSKNFPFAKVVTKWKVVNEHSKSEPMTLDNFYFITFVDKYNKILTKSEIDEFMKELYDFVDNNKIDDVFIRMSYNHVKENMETGYFNNVIDYDILNYKDINNLNVISSNTIPSLEDAYVRNIMTEFIWNKYKLNNDIDIDVYFYGNIPITSAFGNYDRMFYI